MGDSSWEHPANAGSRGEPYFPEQASRLHCKCALGWVLWPQCKAINGCAEEKTQGAVGKMGRRCAAHGHARLQAHRAWGNIPLILALKLTMTKNPLSIA